MILGGYCVEVPPLPIPNRVVKLNYADGTAVTCGRVGNRHFDAPREILGRFFVLRTRIFSLILRITNCINNTQMGALSFYFIKTFKSVSLERKMIQIIAYVKKNVPL